MINRIGWIAFPLLLTSGSSCLAQLPTAGVTDSAAPRAMVERRPVGAHRADLPGRASCLTTTCLWLEDRRLPPDTTGAVTRRGTYAWWGLAIGAGLGWLLANEACRRDDCYGTGFGFAMVAGGAVGLIVGLLLSPG
jgi:hypothetical protein